MAKTVKKVIDKVDSQFKVPSLLVAFICFWIPAILFLMIAEDVLERQAFGIDAVVLHWIHSQTSPFLNAFFLVITTLGGPEVISLITIPIVGILLYRGMRRHSMILLFGVMGAAFANFLLKLLFARERPAFWPSAVVEHNFSFPSGHAMASCALAVCVFIFFWKTRWRWHALILGGVGVILVGFSRLYFGVHYPTDVIAGWAVSIIWVFIVSSVVNDFPFKIRSRLRKILFLSGKSRP